MTHWSRGRIAVSAVLAAALLYVAMCAPRYTRIRTDRGEFDVISLTVETPRTSQAVRYVSVSYYGRANTPPERLVEAEAVMALLARPAAESLHVERIQVQQTYPTFGRWIGIIKGYAWVFDRGQDGAWHRVEM